MGIPVKKPSSIQWGSLEADSDDQLPDHFVLTDRFKIVMERRYWIVSGEKGIGKTALKRSIKEPRFNIQNSFQQIKAVDFDLLNFDGFGGKLTQIEDTVNVSTRTLLINFWDFLLLVETARLLGISFPDNRSTTTKNSQHDLRKTVSAWIRDPQYKIGSALRELIENAWSFFSDGIEVENNDMKSMEAHLLDYPTKTDAYFELRSLVYQGLHNRGETMAIILDGFDRALAEPIYRDHVQNVFEALVEAILNWRKDEILRRYVFVKALIPFDRYLAMDSPESADRIVRDMDKVRNELHVRIQWKKHDLKLFLAKRIDPDVRDNPEDIDAAIYSLLPEKVANKAYGVREDAFDYILRHTMWRPRQIMAFFMRAAMEYPNKILTDDIVRKIVSTVCADHVKSFREEFAMDHRNIKAFIDSFAHTENVLPLREVALRVKKHLKPERPRQDVRQVLYWLYRIGFFGYVHLISNNEPMPEEAGDQYVPSWNAEGQKYYCEFSYRSGGNEGSLDDADDKIVALHPIFFDQTKHHKAHPTIVVG